MNKENLLLKRKNSDLKNIINYNRYLYCSNNIITNIINKYLKDNLKFILNNLIEFFNNQETIDNINSEEFEIKNIKLFILSSDGNKY